MNNSNLHQIKKILLIVIPILIIFGLLLLISYINSFVNVNFRLPRQVDKVIVSGINNSEAGFEVTDQRQFRIKKGQYSLKLIGQNIDQTARTVEIKQPQTIEIDYNYNQQYLEKLLNSEQAEILNLINQKYPKIADLYNIERPRLYQKGEIFGANLVFKDQKADNRDTLKILLLKQKNNWQILSNPPAPILSKQDYPQINPETLTKINRSGLGQD